MGEDVHTGAIDNHTRVPKVDSPIELSEPPFAATSCQSAPSINLNEQPVLCFPAKTMIAIVFHS